MKQGKPVITFVILVLAAALAVYLGFYAFGALNEPFTTTLAYQYTARDSAEASGLLVREEQVLTAQSGIVDVTRSEGEKVGVGQTVALIYRDSQAQADQAQLEALSAEIELLEYAVSQSGDVASAARLDEDILQAVSDLRASAALGDFSRLEDQVMEVKSSVLKRSYTYDDGSTASDLSAQLSSLREQRSALTQQTASATTRVTAGQSGVFSSLVDGYESLITPASLPQLTPSALQTLLDGGGGTADSSAIGKLITSDRWYFAALLPAETADRLRAGETATLRFTGDFTQDVEMTVESLSAPENGQVAAVFSTDRYLARTTLLRQQTAELIFEEYSGLRLPKQALRMETRSYEDEETGETVEEQVLGVYALVSGRAEFKRVEVVVEGEDYYVVRAASSGRTALRAGDEIIVQATGLYDGQLLEF